jgi:hypothetical protein
MIPAAAGIGAWLTYWTIHTYKTIRTEHATRRAWNMYRSTTP